MFCKFKQILTAAYMNTHAGICIHALILKGLRLQKTRDALRHRDSQLLQLEEQVSGTFELKRHHAELESRYCVAVRCSALLCVAVCCSVLQCVAVHCSVMPCIAVCCSVLQCVAVCSSVLQCVTVCCSVLQCVAVCCRVLQRVVACRNVLECVALYRKHIQTQRFQYRA